IDLEDGIEKAISGYGDPKASVITSEVLVALEVAKASNLVWYTDADPEEPRRALLRKRIDLMGDAFVGVLPKVQSSDAHSISALGRNSDRKDKLTRLKVATLDWASFRRAFADPEARVRVEEDVPDSFPHFVGMSLEGGFLHGQTFGLSKNLTCVIGG